MSDRMQHALALAARGFWIFPCIENSKLPAVKDWPNAATRDASQIKTWWSSRAYNIGISTSRYGDHKALCVIDVDNKGGKDGDAGILELEMQGYELPVSFEQATPSGGRHIIYEAPAPYRQGVNVLGDGLDIRSKGGYIVGPGSEIDGKNYARINGHDTLVPTPTWLGNRLGMARLLDRSAIVVLPGVDADRARDRALAYLKIAPRSTEGDGGDSTAYQVAAKLKDLGCSQDQVFELLADHWNDDCVPPWDGDELLAKVAHAFKYGREPQGSAAPEAIFNTAPAVAEAAEADHPVDALNKEYAYIKQGAFILQETTNHKGVFEALHLTPDEFHGWYANKTISVGDKTVPLSRLWIKSTSRREYEAVVFAPEQDRGPRWYNLWRGFSVKPADTADHPAVTAFLEHALQNVCNGDATLCHWLMGWFAHLVQRPWGKPLVALVIRGKKGTGKNALLERVGALFRSHFFVADDDRYLVSNFNSHLESCLFLVLDEAAWAGDKRAEGRLKGLVTGAEHNIERKNKEPYKVDNLTRVAIIGNEAWIAPASNDERRFAVFNVGEGRRQDRRFFHNMRVGMEQGGYAHLLRYLLDFDLSTVDVNAAPNTLGLLEQKLEGLEPVPKWWFECLSEGQIAGGDLSGEWPNKLTKKRLHEYFARWAKLHNIKGWLADGRQFGRALRHVAPSIGDTRYRAEGGQLAYGYLLPTVDDLRTAFEAFIGSEIKWEDA